MARGFGATLGSGTTDIVTTTFTATSTTRSYFIWSLRNGNGGSSQGRMFDKNNGGGGYEIFYYPSAVPAYEFGRNFSTFDGLWDVTAPSTGVWDNWCITYDCSSTTNDPIIYKNGVSQTVTERNTPVGTAVNAAGAFTVGNRQSDSARNWDGSLAEFAVWDAILTADEAAALGKGVVPTLIRPASLMTYVPLLRDNIDLRNGAPSITGTAVQPHVRVYTPGLVLRPNRTIAAAPTFNAAWNVSANSVIQPGAMAA